MTASAFPVRDNSGKKNSLTVTLKNAKTARLVQTSLRFFIEYQEATVTS
jgi:hypothetical protein